MTATRDPVDVFGIDTEIDIPITDQDEGERHALELADKIRTVAVTDPAHAQELVDQLIVALDKAMGGTFREHLDGVTRVVAERALVNGPNCSGADVSSLGNG
ncbi:MAG: hypothetical protein QOE51_3045 [Actinoplanes sp.]|jgi:hypothetical protein|nr:hypothetical protein [Actinoplanes sp.]